jgi:transcriptional regulator with XRE-family HTH domain
MTWEIKKPLLEVAVLKRTNASVRAVRHRLGRRIARQRRAIGMTQPELAEKVGLQPETISRLETGTRGASLEVIADISEALELELHELFRLPRVDASKDLATEKLLWFAARLTAAEIQLVMDVGAAVLGFARRGNG